MPQHRSRQPQSSSPDENYLLQQQQPYRHETEDQESSVSTNNQFSSVDTFPFSQLHQKKIIESISMLTDPIHGPSPP